MNLDVTLERAFGGESPDWTTGYRGDVYQATVDTSNLKSVTWKFGGKTEEYSVSPSGGGCALISGDAPEFSATCEVYDVTMFRSILKYDAGLPSDVTVPVEFTASSDKLEVEFGASETATVSGWFLFLVKL